MEPTRESWGTTKGSHKNSTFDMESIMRGMKIMAMKQQNTNTSKHFYSLSTNTHTNNYIHNI